MTAVPNEGWEFAGWSASIGHVDGSATVAFTVPTDADANGVVLTANFRKVDDGPEPTPYCICGSHWCDPNDQSTWNYDCPICGDDPSKCAGIKPTPSPSPSPSPTPEVPETTPAPPADTPTPEPTVPPATDPNPYGFSRDGSPRNRGSGEHRSPLNTGMATAPKRARLPLLRPPPTGLHTFPRRGRFSGLSGFSYKCFPGKSTEGFMQKTSRKKGLLLRFWPYLKKYRRVLVFDLFCAALTTIATWCCRSSCAISPTRP